MARSKSTARGAAAKKVSTTRKRRAAAKKASTTRKRRAAAKKALTTRKRRAATKKALTTRKRRGAAKKAAATRNRLKSVDKSAAPGIGSPERVVEIDQRIAIIRGNLRELTEQAAAFSGSSTEELMAERIATQEAKLEALRQQRERLLSGS